jgi:hypothetical protein
VLFELLIQNAEAQAKHFHADIGDARIIGHDDLL